MHKTIIIFYNLIKDITFLYILSHRNKLYLKTKRKKKECLILRGIKRRGSLYDSLSEARLKARNKVSLRFSSSNTCMDKNTVNISQP